MTRALAVIDDIRIASTCSAPWADMVGDNRVRRCAQCELNVYNIAEMTRAEAESLIRKTEGRLCVRFFRRLDGTVLLRDCPDGLQRVRSGLARVLKFAAAAIVLVAGAFHFVARGCSHWDDVRLRDFQPFSRLIDWLEPKAQGPFVGGAGF